MKEVLDIRDEFFDEGKISPKSMQDLIWHLENDPFPDRAITLVTDARLINIAPLMAKYLDHEDSFIRELTVGCLVGRLGLAEYAQKALKMAQEDPEGGPRALATSGLGKVINKVNPFLKKNLATYLCDVLANPLYDSIDKRCAFDSILTAMDVPILEVFQTPYDENHPLINDFKIKYGIK